MRATLSALPTEPPASGAFAAQLRRSRRAAGLTQEALAERAGLSVRGISDLERGVKAPQRATVDLLASGLGLAPEEAHRFVLAAQRRRDEGADGARRAVPPLPTPPAPLTSFVGRERELAALRGLLGTSRLLTLTGVGGVGKTRLALRLAPAVAPDFPDGAVFVPLADLTEQALVLPAVARAFRVQPGQRDLGEVLAELLRPRRLLLVLDNCEQVAASAPALGALLAACPRLTILATSRAPLSIYGERVFPVPPLAVPEETPLPLRALASIEAVALFLARAQAVEPDFVLRNENAAAVAAICRQLDGLPLALELAAARVRLLPPSALQRRLEHRLALLTGGAGDLPPRQRTLRATLAWSYDLLTPGEQALFRRLGVFAGGATLEGIAVVAAAGPPGLDVLEALDGLARHSLVRSEEQDGEPRFRMLETVREFALEQLALSGEAETAQAAQVEALLRLLDGELGPEQWGPFRGFSMMGVAQLERERANLRPALGWCSEHGDAVRGLRLASRSTALWWQAGPRAEGLAWLRRFLDWASEETPAWLRLRARWSAAWLAYFLGDLPTMRAYASEGLALARSRQEEPARMHFLLSTAMLALHDGDLPAAQAAAEQALLPARGLQAPAAQIDALMHLGTVAQLRCQVAEATAAYQEALAIGRALPFAGPRNWTERNLGLLALEVGRLAEAAAHLGASLRATWSARLDAGALETLNAFAVLAGARGQWERAARLLGAVDIGLERLGGMLPRPIGRPEWERTLAAAREQLGEPAFAAAYAAGRALSLDQAVTEALGIEAPVRPDTTASTAMRGPLTPREREVAALIARGFTNGQIAAALVISERTAGTHVGNILGKLGFATRSQVAAWVASQQRLSPRSPGGG